MRSRIVAGSRAWTLGLLLTWLGCATVPHSGTAAVVVVDPRVVAQVRPEFLSVSLDISQVVGGRFWGAGGGVELGAGETPVSAFDFQRPELLERARALAPAYLRIGGTEADTTWYALDAPPPSPLPPHFTAVLTAERWAALVRFSTAARMPLLFTLAAGPGVRGSRGEWLEAQASGLLRHAQRRQDPVVLWELGNEVNAFPVMHGPAGRISGREYARDLQTARELVETHFPQAALAGPTSAYWPVIGEPFPVLRSTLRHARGALGVVSWHYYPQQSRRCPVAVRRAGLEVMLQPDHLAEVDRWATQVEQAKDRFEPGAELWMTETGNAQCGGEPGVSSRFVSSLWWMDQLGRLARRNHQVVVRQTLVGSDYGLLDPETLRPRPDYHASILWKQHMGTRVLGARSSSPQVTAYAHCAPPLDGRASLLLINVGPTPAQITVEGATGAELTVASASGLDSEEVILSHAAPGTSVFMRGTSDWTLPPHSYAFLRLDNHLRHCVAVASPPEP